EPSSDSEAHQQPRRTFLTHVSAAVATFIGIVVGLPALRTWRPRWHVKSRPTGSALVWSTALGQAPRSWCRWPFRALTAGDGSWRQGRAGYPSPRPAKSLSSMDAARIWAAPTAGRRKAATLALSSVPVMSTL